MGFFKTLFSVTGLLIVAYTLIGVFYNTAPPHIPIRGTQDLATYLHRWVQYFISVLLWPLSLWDPPPSTWVNGFLGKLIFPSFPAAG